jgi:hypothetical protein
VKNLFGSQLTLKLKGTDCMASFLAAPVCADSTWSLWNATIESNGAYWCCLSGQVGVQTINTLGCVGNGAETSSETAANSVCILFRHEHYVAILSMVSQLGQPAPTGTAAFIGGGTVATGTSTSKGGNLLSTLVGIVTQHSDSRRVEPRPFNIPLTGIVGCGFAALSFIGGILLMVAA